MKVGVLAQYIMWRFSQSAWFGAKPRCTEVDEVIRNESEYYTITFFRTLRTRMIAYKTCFAFNGDFSWLRLRLKK